MCEHYTPETFAAQLAEILAHPLYGAPWPQPYGVPEIMFASEAAPAQAIQARKQMIEWCLVNLTFYSAGAKSGIARIYDYDGITSLAAWRNLTSAYREIDGRFGERLHPIYVWLQSAHRITVAGARYWRNVEAPLVLIDRRAFINSPHAPPAEDRLTAQLCDAVVRTEPVQ